MSKITDGFEDKLAHGLPMYPMKEVDELLAHTRALEEMLFKHEWSDTDDYGTRYCPECQKSKMSNGHSPDCELAKLLK